MAARVKVAFPSMGAALRLHNRNVSAQPRSLPLKAFEVIGARICDECTMANGSPVRNNLYQRRLGVHERTPPKDQPQPAKNPQLFG